MQQRGRQNQFAAQVVSLRPLTPRPEPPEELNEEQAQIWRQLIASMPGDWFRPECESLVVALCRHISYSRAIGARLNALNFRSEEDMERFAELAKLHKNETQAIANLATRLRLTPQSRYTAVAASTAVHNAAPARKPWDTAS